MLHPDAGTRERRIRLGKACRHLHARQPTPNTYHPKLRTFTNRSGDRKPIAGFAQSLQATYLTPLTPKLTLMAGGYVNNLNWGGINARNAGIYGELSYQFNEHWEAFIYGQKSFLKPEMPLPLYYMHDVGDRIGAAVRYTPNHTFSVTVSVEGRSEPSWLPAMPFANRYNDFPYDGMDW